MTGRPTTLVTNHRGHTDEASTRYGGDLRAIAAGAYERRRDAERSLFGLGTNPSSADVISMRDAQDRVARMRPGDFRPAIDKALMSGDRTFAAAILSAAIEMGFDYPVNAYLAEYPGDEPLVQALTNNRGVVDVAAGMVMAP